MYVAEEHAFAHTFVTVEIILDFPCLMSQRCCLKVFYTLIILISHTEFTELGFQLKWAGVTTAVLPLLCPFDNVPYCHRIWHGTAAAVQTPPSSPLWDFCIEHHCSSVRIDCTCKLCGHGARAWREGGDQPRLERSRKGAEVTQTSQAPAPRLIADSGWELLQNVSAFSLELIDLNDCLKLTQCKAGWRKPNSEKWNMPSVRNLECWAELFLLYAALCHRYTQPTVIFSTGLQQFRKLLWFCPLHQKCLVCGAFC